ncbi:hypothetical protein F5876DRAFT_75697 [Lentinula aff. lateritia]|uniref:Uncharacterized protein n=1 Tax=Lentinula aff. lateritia TaxID=2804960 RepID=A0ACC1U4B2_9AGAR|nr:hypothetical protein F5876DRAFT_75697 [Lentinula aff. lateritia]
MLPAALLDYTIQTLTAPLAPFAKAKTLTGPLPLCFSRHLATAAAAVALKASKPVPQHVSQQHAGLAKTAEQAEHREHGEYGGNLVLKDLGSSSRVNIGRRNRRATAIEIRQSKPSTDSSAAAKSNANAITVELARRVRALEKVTDEKDTELDPPVFSEEDLLTLYEEVLAHPDTHVQEKGDNKDIRIKTNEFGLELGFGHDPESQHGQDLDVLVEADLRLSSHAGMKQQPQHTRFAAALLRESKLNESTQAKSTDTSTTSMTPVCQRVLNHTAHILQDIERVEESLISQPRNAEENENSTTKLPITLLSKQEWDALIRATVHTRNVQLAEKTMESMERCNLTIPEEYLNAVLQLHIESRDLVALESCSPTPQQQHLHIKSHLLSTPQHTLPTSALSVLHTYEMQSTPAPMKSYTSTIHRLFTINPTVSPIAHLQAWDLFSHMRYVAHPVPDAILYTEMIRACASSSVNGTSDPERALDLFTEMRLDHNITPLQRTWDSLILACARTSGSLSRRQKYVNEAFRLAREMLDSYRDAYGRPKYTPDKKTFCALLEGAKRIGDLGRVRWILAEMVRGKGVSVEVDEEVMMHVFHAYAAYRPPFKRSLARVVEETGNSSVSSEGDVPSAQTPSTNSESVSNASIRASSSFLKSTHPDTFSAFSHVPPQTSSEVITEVDILFDRILDERSETKDDDILSGKFSSVKPTTRLLNSYLSVYYNHHQSLEAARSRLVGVFYQVTDVQPDARTYVEALERCAISKKHERGVALRFAEEVFEKWEGIENKVGVEAVVSPRIIERAHVAWIRMLTLTNNTDRALFHLRTFVQKYPASAIRLPQKSSIPIQSRTTTFLKPAMRSTRTSLVGARPLVRLTSPVSAASAISIVSPVNGQVGGGGGQIPPLLMWRDLEVLHHRIIAGVGFADDETKSASVEQEQEQMEVTKPNLTSKEILDATLKARKEKREKREKDLAYIKWVCKSYEWALRVRRDETMRAGVEAQSKPERELTEAQSDVKAEVVQEK